MTFAAGDLIGGRYQLEEHIGSGGMGQVFRARDTVLARPVAIKLVDAVEPRRREEITQGFLREARISAAIDHRNVVRILDFGTHQSTVPYMVMELLEGESLGDVLGRGDAMPFDWLMGIVTEVLDGLAAAHDAGVVHRDLKPENIFLVRDRGRVYPKILDFGISKLLDSTGTARVTTTHGHVVGTPAYMSPEQARGVRHIDQRTDLYSMGVVIYELLCGEMPFFSENPGDLMLMIMTQEAVPLAERLPDLGVELSNVVAKAMSKRAEDRYATAREMQEALLAAAQKLLGSSAMERLDARLRPVSWRREGSSGDPLAAGQRALLETELLPRRSTPVTGQRRTRQRLLLAGLGAGAMLLGAVVVAVWLGRTSADSAPRFIVVRAEPAPPAAAPEPEVAPQDPPAGSAPAPIAEISPAVLAQRKPSAPRSKEDTLAESFRRQKAGVVACLNAHASSAERVPKLSVKLGVSKEGNVERASVSPADLSMTPMGSCIEKAVRGMRFPPQAQALSFEVPLTAKKGG